MINVDELKLHMTNILTEVSALDSKVVEQRSASDVVSRRRLNRIHDVVRKLKLEVSRFESFLATPTKK